MSEEAQAMQGNTEAVQAPVAQAQAPSEGEPVLKPAAAITAEQSVSEQAAAINQAVPVDTVQRAQAPAEPSATQEPSEAKEKDLGLLGKTKPVDSEGAPEAYEPFTFSEGIEVEEADVAALQGIAKEMGLPQAAAQAGAEMTARALNQMIENAQKESEAWKTEQMKAWNEAPQSAENTLLAKKALEHAGLLDYASESGYMYDAKLLSAFAEFGKLISEAKVIVGAEGSPAQGSTNPYVNSPVFK